LTVGASPIVVVCMPERGHLQRLLPLIEGLSARGRTVHVMTDARFGADVARAGGLPFDLFARHPLDAADATSIPVPSRYVSFAATYAEAVSRQVAALAPALILYDTFAVIAPLIGRRLGVPYVNVCAGHAAVPSRAVAALRNDPRVATSAECWAAVRRLRDAYGMSGAGPFSYVEGLSPFLNVYCEPPQFLDESDRATFEPLVFFGSLAPQQREARASERPFRRARPGLKVYVSFGTVVWRYFEAIAYAALGTLADVFSDLDAEVVMSLGNHELGEARRARLARATVRVERSVDQWAVLKDADLFVTHHGLNSTHESIFHQVPMVSYPFFDDQPALARHCQELGLAVALAAAPRAPVERDAVVRALHRLADERSVFAARLAEARSWELAVIDDRDAVFERILALT
jgi:MGT family glycosyltransferase